MSIDLFLEKQNKAPDFGYTTGTCAAAASCAASKMLAENKEIPFVFFSVPKGMRLVLEVLDIHFGQDYVSCAVKKNSGSDPDITNGVLVYSKVKFNSSGEIKIDGGEGIGTVTLPGLDQSVGSAAINSVPRKMIFDVVKQNIPAGCGADVTIYIPGGKELAEKTFNPRLGIKGGLSILGTTGIVEPMSSEALLKTIELEVSIRNKKSFPILPVAPGNYGASFFYEQYGFPLDTCVTSSNFIYDTVRYSVDYGFTRMLFVGHVGKLIKVAAGIKNTHSKYGDFRMETFCSVLDELCEDCDYAEAKEKIMQCVSTESAIDVLEDYGAREKVCKEVVRKIKANMQEWSGNKLSVEVIVFSMKHGLLGMSQNAYYWMEELKSFGGFSI